MEVLQVLFLLAVTGALISAVTMSVRVRSKLSEAKALAVCLGEEGAKRLDLINYLTVENEKRLELIEAQKLRLEDFDRESPKRLELIHTQAVLLEEQSAALSDRSAVIRFLRRQLKSKTDMLPAFENAGRGRKRCHAGPRIQFAAPQSVTDVGECFFYHAMDIPGIGCINQPTSWDLRGRFSDYIGGVNVRDRSVLDVGSASGFLSFEAEKAGASEVISFDAASPSHLQVVPYSDISDVTPGDILKRLTNGYWFAHRALRSKAKVIYGDVYELSQQAPQCDIVLLGQILVHLRDPFEALRQACLVATEYVIVAEGSFEAEGPVSVFLGTEGNFYSWWHYSVPLYKQIFPIFGFQLVSIGKNEYIATHPDVTRVQEIWTFVAKRTRAT